MTSFASLVRQTNLINGQWVGADSGQTIDVTDPATGATIASVPNSGQAETQRAIDAAHDAFPAYAGLTLGERVAPDAQAA
jgi:succinate-semialdehyde dehydrogenase/glutarate-semialdehyde dehydrogenase